MSDLISRSVLFKELNDKKIPWNRKINDIIMAQPVAYNIDAVVAELRNLPTKGIDRYKGGAFGDYEGTDYFIDKHKAIDIVIKGGVDNG